MAAVTAERAPAESRTHAPWKRSACDRCRGQKLRCLRQEDDRDCVSACLRCARCQTPCITSLAKPMGRPSKSISSGTKHPRSHVSLKDSFDGSKSTADSQSNALATTDAPPMTNVMPNMEAYTPSADDVNMYDFFVQEHPIQLDTSGLFENCGDGQFPQPSVMPLKSPALSVVPMDNSMKALPSIEPNKPESDPGVLLANLYQHLSKQLLRVRTVPWDVKVLAMNYPAGFETDLEVSDKNVFNPLGTILGSTADFLEVIRMFDPPEGSGDRGPWSPLPSPPLYPSRHPLPLQQFVLDSPVPSPDMFPTESVSEPSSASSLSSSCPSTPHLLTLLSCYLQTVAIYDAIFIHILDELARMPEFAESMLRGSSGLFFAGYTVPMEAGLLMRLLVQVVEHQFELIERAIGLPLEYCMSSNGSPGGGLLSGQEGRSLLTTVGLFTVNNTDGSGVLKATASLQDSMRKLKQLL